MPTCPQCGKDHPAPTTEQKVLLILRLLAELSPTPREGADLLAIALGQLAAYSQADLDVLVKLVQDNHVVGQAVSSSPLPPRGTSWAC